MLGVLVTLAVLSLGVLLLLRCLAAWGAGGRLVSLVSLAQGEARSGEGGAPGWQVFLWSFGFRVLLLGAGMLAAVLLSQGELSPEGAFRQLLRWDGNHYKNLVELGYAGYVENGQHLFLVFFPGYVWAVRLLRLFIPDTQAAGMLLSCLCASGGSCYVYKLARDCGGPAVARDALFYLSLFPFSFFSSLMMTEGLFLLASAGACYYARRRQWILYGVFGAAAALTRMTGLLVILPAAVELLAGERPLAPAAGRSKHCWRRVFCRLPLVLFPAAGTVSYLLLNAWVDGDPFAFVKHQEHWYQGFLWVSQVVEYMVDYFAANALLSVGWAVWFPGLALFLGGMLLLYWGVLRGALPPSLLAYGFFFFTATYCLSWLLSAGRYLSCCFPLFLLLGRLTENRPGFRSALLAGEGISLGLYYCAFLTGAQVM